MKAVTIHAYGGPEVLRVQEVSKPTVKPNEVLVEVKASGVTTADALMRQGTPRFARLFLGLRKPKHTIVGTGFAGVVVDTGSEVTRFQAGDEVFGETSVSFGANAEFVAVPDDGVILKKPAFLDFNSAALLCDGPLTSMNFLQNLGEVQPGQRVLINGASGSLGTAAVQLAKQMGAQVTGVCSSKNVEMVRSLGADEVIDYTKTDFTKESATYDVIYDTVGKSSFGASKRVLAQKGKYLSPVISIGLLFQMLGTSIIGSKKALFDATGLKKPEHLKDMLHQLLVYMQEDNFKVVIDRQFSLEQAVDAHAYVDSGHKRGNVVLAMGA
jgi:NADPH:quinone reductase-like Zn-dependent oxidoreductase